MTSAQKQTQQIPSATIRFAGDSGDGMQIAGMQFTDTSAIFGNDIATLPDYPAEIRAPAGTVAGVSGFQINFASSEIHTPGDSVDALIAMNPAAFKANIEDVRSGGVVIVNESEFNKVNLRKAGYEEGYNPILDEVLTARFNLFPVPITRLTQEALADTGMSAKDIGRSKNMYALGLIYWLFDRPIEPTVNFLQNYFGKKKNLPQVADANELVLKAGFHFGETAEMFVHRYHVDKADIAPGKYRRVTGNEALAMGLIAASKLSGKDLVYCSYPITPASDILHHLAAQKQFGAKTVQAEDEIAAVCAAIGVSFAGQLGVTGTSGPGLCLKAEAVGLAVMTELPLVIIDVQRGGPSTGLPTKVEQSDLFQALYGRNGDSPVVVVAPKSPADCFEVGIEAVRVATGSMVPVIILSDGYIANGAEPWLVPSADDLEPIEIEHPVARNGAPEAGAGAGGDDGIEAGEEGSELAGAAATGDFEPYARDEKLARPWAVPGTKGLQHRLGGLEKANITGNVSYIPSNHQVMTGIRHEKIDRIADRLPAMEVEGDASGDVLVLGWGGTYGAIKTAVAEAREKGLSVGATHLRWLNPMPKDLPEILGRFEKVLIPELNMGQLRHLIRGRFMVDAKGLNKIQGQPFMVSEVLDAIEILAAGRWPADREYLMPEGHAVTVDEPAAAGAAR